MDDKCLKEQEINENTYIFLAARISWEKTITI